jgi:hypothetical protein
MVVVAVAVAVVLTQAITTGQALMAVVLDLAMVMQTKVVVAQVLQLLVQQVLLDLY